MTDLLHVLPEFSVKNYTHLIPSLEKHLVTTSDLLTLDALEIAKRAQLPILDVKRLINEVISLLHGQLGFDPPNNNDAQHARTAPVTTPTSKRNNAPLYTKGSDLLKTWSTISTLDSALDSALGSGIPTGYITEITGESGAGKTQLLLTLLLSAQLPPPHGLSRPTIYISTEAPLPTSRLQQLLTQNPLLSSHPAPNKPTLSRILSLQTLDLESQEHILSYQLPVALSTHKAGLVVIDSIAANYRAESSTGSSTKQSPAQSLSLAARSASLVRTGTLLKNLAREHSCAVVVANQVADRIEHTSHPQIHLHQPTTPTAAPWSSPLPHHPSSSQLQPPPPSSLPAHLPSSPSPNPNPVLRQIPFRDGPPSPTITDTRLSLDHQMRFFTGWGANLPSLPDTLTLNASNSQPQPSQQMAPKTPALGLAWSNQLACRMALFKEAVWVRDELGEGEGSAEWTPRRWRRWFSVVFAGWTEPTSTAQGVEIEIWKGGVRKVEREQ